MAFSDLQSQEGQELIAVITSEIETDIETKSSGNTYKYFSNDDPFKRKLAYIGLSRIFKNQENKLPGVINLLNKLIDSGNEIVRQTVIYSAGEIGISYFADVEHLLVKGFTDQNKIVRETLIGAIKRIGDKNPEPILKFADNFITHTDAEVRKEICHGIESRGKTHPEEVLPILRKLENDDSDDVIEMLVHVVSQISYSEGSLRTIIDNLKLWDNKTVVKKVLLEIIETYSQYNATREYSSEEVEDLIKTEFSDLF